jgi:hypothetical protein
MREFYRSPNGDRWLLGREARSGSLFVRHEANPASGGYTSQLDISTFLAQSPRHPQHDALLRLLGSLVESSIDPADV